MIELDEINVYVMDFYELINKFHQFGGARIVWQYALLGILPVVVKLFFHLMYKRQLFNSIVRAHFNRIVYLINDYGVNKA